MDNIFSFLNNQEMNYIFMEIRQLEYFRAIVDAGTISGAARVLHMTQPPLSYQMKMLEEELQVSLFLRGTKKITLTDRNGDDTGEGIATKDLTALIAEDLTGVDPDGVQDGVVHLDQAKDMKVINLDKLLM